MFRGELADFTRLVGNIIIVFLFWFSGRPGTRQVYPFTIGIPILLFVYKTCKFII
jgi:hypothetical protein